MRRQKIFEAMGIKTTYDARNPRERLPKSQEEQETELTVMISQARTILLMPGQKKLIRMLH